MMNDRLVRAESPRWDNFHELATYDEQSGLLKKITKRATGNDAKHPLHAVRSTCHICIVLCKILK